MKPRTLFLAGDVMTGRGIDQALRRPSRPELHEPEVRDARRYLQLAENANGPVHVPLAPEEPWGDAVEILAETRPDARIVNLETAITTSDDWCRDKEVHYRMHPDNVACLTAAGIDVAVVANNHTLDWGRAGLCDTLAALAAAGIATAGAGRSREEAWTPAVRRYGAGGRVVVLAVGSTTAGIPPDWEATDDRPGLALVDEHSMSAADRVAARLAAARQPGDLGIVSIHWGSNWGHGVADEARRFAHRLIDAGCDLVHGHSSHHVRPIEVYRDRLILHGCGDFLDDYEGIGGHERERPDLGAVFLPTLDGDSGRLLALSLVPTRMRGFQVRRATPDDARWLADTLTRISRPFGCHVEATSRGPLMLLW